MANDRNEALEAPVDLDRDVRKLLLKSLLHNIAVAERKSNQPLALATNPNITFNHNSHSHGGNDIELADDKNLPKTTYSLLP